MKGMKNMKLAIEMTIKIRGVDYVVLEVNPSCCEYHPFGTAVLMRKGTTEFYEVFLDSKNEIVKKSLTKTSLHSL